jgi:excisionase family DNA binding protein
MARQRLEPNVSERLVDAQAVANLLGVPVSWVRQATRSGAMPHVTLGRYKRYQPAKVLAWVEECSEPGRPVSLRTVSPTRSA